MTIYTYRGDRWTRPELRGARCAAVRRADGRCIRGKNGSMLVRFERGEAAVLFRSLDPAQSRIWDQQARAVGIQVQRGRVLEQLRGLSFEAAVSRAYWLGYRAAHTARRRGTAA